MAIHLHSSEPILPSAQDHYYAMAFEGEGTYSRETYSHDFLKELVAFLRVLALIVHAVRTRLSRIHGNYHLVKRGRSQFVERIHSVRQPSIRGRGVNLLSDVFSVSVFVRTSDSGISRLSLSSVPLVPGSQDPHSITVRVWRFHQTSLGPYCALGRRTTATTSYL